MSYYHKPGCLSAIVMQTKHLPVLFSKTINSCLGSVQFEASVGTNAVFEDVPLTEFMYPAFTRMPGKSYRRRLRSLQLCLSDVF